MAGSRRERRVFPPLESTGRGASSALLRTANPLRQAGALGDRVGRAFAGFAPAPAVDTERRRAVPDPPTRSARDRRCRFGLSQPTAQRVLTRVVSTSEPSGKIVTGRSPNRNRRTIIPSPSCRDRASAKLSGSHARKPTCRRRCPGVIAGGPVLTTRHGVRWHPPPAGGATCRSHTQTRRFEANEAP
jgi:hypothetical protein